MGKFLYVLAGSESKYLTFAKSKKWSDAKIIFFWFVQFLSNLLQSQEQTQGKPVKDWFYFHVPDQ
jgi:hypothetical protein